MNALLRRLNLMSLRSRMLVIFVGALCAGQALYVVLDAAQTHAQYEESMMHRAANKFALQAEAVVDDPAVELPARTSSPINSRSRVWRASSSAALDRSWQDRDLSVEARARAALERHGLVVEEIEASSGKRAWTETERAGVQNPARRWYPRHDISISARIEGLPGWLNMHLRSLASPPPIGPGLLLENLAIVALIGAAGVVLVVVQIASACRDLNRAVARVGLSGDLGLSPVRGPTEFHETIRTLNRTSRQLSELLVEKDIMLGAIGHDLRTPLTSLRLTLEGMEPEEARDRAIATIEQTSDLLDDILEFARSGKSDEPAKRYDLGALVADVVTDEQERGRDVSLDCEERIIAACRPASIRRLVQNLVGNAVAYAGHARVILGDGDGGVRLVVEDDGPGVPDSELAALVLPFHRGEGSRNRATGGVGLGLTISRAIARSHGGEITLANKSPHGLRVEVDLPA